MVVLQVYITLLIKPQHCTDWPQKTLCGVATYFEFRSHLYKIIIGYTDKSKMISIDDLVHKLMKYTTDFSVSDLFNNEVIVTMRIVCS